MTHKSYMPAFALATALSAAALQPANAVVDFSQYDDLSNGDTFVRFSCEKPEYYEIRKWPADQLNTLATIYNVLYNEGRPFHNFAMGRHGTMVSLEDPVHRMLVDEGVFMAGYHGNNATELVKEQIAKTCKAPKAP